MNAPVPPSTDGQVDSLKQPSQFPGGYGPGFSSQPESSVDQPDITQDPLQSGDPRAFPGCLKYIELAVRCTQENPPEREVEIKGFCKDTFNAFEMSIAQDEKTFEAKLHD